MIIACIGDSLTEGDHGIKGVRGVANVTEVNYPNFLAKITGAEVRNYGRCGWRSSTMLAWYKTGEIEVQDADVVVIMLGTNGGQASEGSSPENEAYTELVKRIRADVPEAKVYLCTPPNATVNPMYSNCGYAPQVAEAVGFVRSLSKQMNLPLIDLALSRVITPENEARLQGNDGLHFTDEGYRVLAEEIAAGLGFKS
ncbi:MAG: SGNH/GDSL hydrolase family protein [Clostridia bacterium]|nr:SGNH/GDSL hydrolase family protein [Clostridia bacterium]